MQNRGKTLKHGLIINNYSTGAMSEMVLGATRLVGFNDIISNKREWNKRRPKNIQYLSSPGVFVDAFRLPYLWSMVYELIYHCLLTNQNSGITIYHR